MANPTLESAATRFAACMFALLLPLAGACGGDDESPKSLFSEPCTTTADCADALECKLAIGICSQSCATQQECRSRLGSETVVCSGGACQEPCTAGSLRGCADGTRCIVGLEGATCRVK